MVSVLPERPDLDQLRRRAKELRAAAVAGDEQAVARIREHSTELTEFTLSAAQLAIAREYGFPSWPRLIVEVQRKQLIQRGDVAGLRRLLAEHPRLATAKVSSPLSSRRSSALEYVALARFHGSLDTDSAGALARVLLEAGAAVNPSRARGESPLITAASYGELDMTRVLIEAGADLEATGHAVPGGTALAHAVEFGSPDVVDLLVQAGASVHGIVEAAGVGRIEPDVLEAAAPSDLARALRAAAVCERLEVIDQLLAHGVDVNVDVGVDGNEETALHWAAWQAKVRSIEHLIANGADPDRRERQYDMTPLGWYRYRRDELVKVNNPHHLVYAESIERLLGAGADNADARIEQPPG